MNQERISVMMKTKKTVVTTLALVVLVICLTASGWLNGAQADRPGNRVAYTIVWHASVLFDDGRIADTFTETRYVSSRDSWRSVKVFSDGTEEESFAEKGRGMFVLDHSERMMYRVRPYRRSENPQRLLRSDRYVATHNLLGHTVYQLRHREGDTEVEAFYSPDLNGDLIKQVVRRAGSTMMLEPKSISLGEPTSEQLAHVEYSRVRMLPENQPARFSHRTRKQ
jgi:hypothetical protein